MYYLEFISIYIKLLLIYIEIRNICFVKKVKNEKDFNELICFSSKDNAYYYWGYKKLQLLCNILSHGILNYYIENILDSIQIMNYTYNELIHYSLIELKNERNTTWSKKDYSRVKSYQFEKYIYVSKKVAYDHKLNKDLIILLDDNSTLSSIQNILDSWNPRESRFCFNKDKEKYLVHGITPVAIKNPNCPLDFIHSSSIKFINDLLMNPALSFFILENPSFWEDYFKSKAYSSIVSLYWNIDNSADTSLMLYLKNKIDTNNENWTWKKNN